MMAVQRDDDDELPAPIAEALVDVGLAPEAATLKELIASIPSLLADRKRVAALEREVKQRRVQWPLTALVPMHVDPETARKSAERGGDGDLIAEKIGGRWFASVDNMESWLARTGKWFKTKDAEERWRATIKARFS
jgi:hypothetical protein